MKTNSACIVLTFFFALILSTLAADELVFDAKPQQGVKYVFTCSTNQTTDMTIRFPGTGRSSERKDSCTVTLSGTLVYDKDVRKAVFDIAAATAVFNGEKADVRRLTNRKLLIDFTSEDAPFMLAGVFNEDNPVLPIPEKPTRLESEIFSRVFQQSGGGTESLFGANRADAKPGDKWKCNASSVAAALTARGIKAEKENISAEAEYRGKGKVMEKDHAIISLDVESHGIQGCDFKASSVVYIPCEGKKRVPSKILRNGTEIINRRIPRDNPFYAGAVIESISNDDTTIMMIEKSDFGK